jgi:carbonic anhydrase
MNAETPAASDASAATPTRRFAPKLLIVGGASALTLVMLITAALLLFWPKPPEAVDAKARTGKVAARKTAAAASASAESAASATVAAAAASANSVALDDHRAPEAHATQPPATPAPTTTAHAPAPAVDDPMDRLRRRLGQALGAKGGIDAARPGEWRVLTRSATVAPVAHVEPGDSGKVPAQPHAASAGVHAAAHHATGSAVHWAYEGKAGPQAWGRLKPEFSQCATGSRQSPIDIRDGLALDLDPVQFDYHSGSFGVIDNGHTVQVNVPPGNSIEANGRRYDLLQFHFHRPSEERINGRQFEMVAHLVHKDAEGRLAVVAVLLDRGAAQPLLQTVWNHLPLEKNETVAARAQIDLNQLLPADRRYYTYMGSLTTPPCSEGVLWLVMQQPVQVSGPQIDIFSRLYPMNARPIQQAAGRMIKQSN